MTDRARLPHDNDDEQVSGKRPESVDEQGARKDRASRSSSKEFLDTYIGSVVHGPHAAKRFNDLIARTLKLKPSD